MKVATATVNPIRVNAARKGTSSAMVKRVGNVLPLFVQKLVLVMHRKRSEVVSWSAPAPDPGTLLVRIRWVDCPQNRQPCEVVGVNSTKSALIRHK